MVIILVTMVKRVVHVQVIVVFVEVQPIHLYHLRRFLLEIVEMDRLMQERRVQIVRKM